MNTRFGYGYADKRNCKQYKIIVIAGTITWEQIAPYLTAQNAFIPGQVGLEDLQYRFALPGKDHPWHQIKPEDVRPTEAEPTTTLTAAELAERFASSQWDADWSSEIVKTKLEELVAREKAIDTTILRDSASQEAKLNEGQRQIRARMTRTRKMPTRTKLPS